MTALATAFVEARLDTSKFPSDIRRGMTSGSVASGMKSAGTDSGKHFGSGFLASTAKIAGVAAVAFGTVMVKRFVGDSITLEASFSKTMNTLAAVANVPQRQMGKLSDLALQMGKDTVFSASDASQAMLELAKGGISPAVIQAGALKSALTLAAAGGVSMADAATTMGNALNAFNLKGKDSAAVASALAGAANASSASIESLSQGLGQAATVAADTGLNVQETTAALAAFSNAGLAGSDAGTSLKTMLTRLVPQSKIAGKAFEVMGLGFTKSDGSFKSLAGIADELRQKFGQMSDEERAVALNTTFGSDARRAATILMNEGAEGVRKYIKATSDQTAAEKTATAGMKGTAGAIEQMKGSIETAKLAFGLAIQPIVVFGAGVVTQIANKAVPIFQDLGEELTKFIKQGPSIQEMGESVEKAFGGIDWDSLGAIVNKFFTQFRAGLSGAGSSIPSFTDLLNVVGVTLSFVADHADLLAKALPFLVAGFVAVKIAQLGANIASAATPALRIAEMVVNRRLTLSNVQLTAAMRAQTLSLQGSAIAEVENTTAKSTGLIASVRSAIATAAKTVVEKAAAAASRAMAAAQWLVNAALTANPIGLVVVALAALGAGLVIAYKKSETFRKIINDAFHAIVGAVVGGVATLIDAFASFLDGVLSAFGAIVDGAASAFGWIPGIGDDIGRAKDAFHTFAEATVNNLHNVADGLRGVSDEVRGIPDPKINTGPAQAAISGLSTYVKQQLAGIKDEGVGINLTTKAESVLYTLQHTHGYLGGGRVSGAGTGTSDSIPALLSNGEHVITADEVKKAGGHQVWEGLRRLAIHGSLHKVGDVGRFAGGGAVINPRVRDSGAAAAISTASSAFAAVASRISSAVSSAVSAVIETMSPAIRGLDFAKAQVGKPYVWGGVGPGGYDCSGYMSAIANASVGRNPYSRLGTSAGTPWPGFAGGTIGDPGFSTASTPNFGGSGIGHVWGRIAGMGVESSGGSGPHVGNTLSLGDSHASAFQHQVYDKGGILSPGYTLAYNGTGADEYVARFAKGGAVSRADRRANRKDAAQTAADAAQAAAEALKSLEQVFKHFGFGDRAGAGTIKDELRTLIPALVGVFGKDGHVVKAVKETSAALMGVAKDRDHIAAALDRSQSKLASLIIARQTLEKDIAGGFNTTVYGDSGPTTAAGLFLSARAEINDARHFKKVLQRLKAKGLAPSILKALALAGPSAILQAESLAALSPKKLNQYEDLLQQGNRLESSLGGVVGSAVYNQQIAEQRKQTHQLNHELGQLNRRIEHLDDRIEHAVERALNHVRIELDGKRVDRALADHTHRRQRTGS